MSHFIVTGGAGFIGFPLCVALLEAGHSVECIDNLSSSLRQGYELRALELATGDRFRWHPSRVSAWYWANYDNERPDGLEAIFHLASPVGPAGVLRHEGSIASEIISDAEVLGNLAAEWETRLVFVSTSEVYGGGAEGLCREDMTCLVPPGASARLEYALGKLAAEVALLNMRAKLKGEMDVVIVRPFNVAGPGQNPAGGFVLPRFLAQARRNEPLTVFGDGTALRAFTHVADVVDGLLLAAEKGWSGEVYNLGNPANVTAMSAFAELVQRVTGSSSALRHTDGRVEFGPLYAEASDKFPDAAKAMRELGWNPSRSLEDVVRDAWMEVLREANDAPARI